MAMGLSPRNPARFTAGRHYKFVQIMLNRLLFSLALGLLMLPTKAHEVSSNRGTLILREANHISLSLRVHLDDLMHDVVAAKLTPFEFLEQFASMPTREFEMQYARVQSLVESETRIVLPSGKVVALRQWRWPDTRSFQSQIRESAMQMAVAPHDHLPEQENEIFAEATAKEDFSAISLRLAPQLRPILIVNYRPHQVWMEQQTSQVKVRF